jgi:hypothetical protein
MNFYICSFSKSSLGSFLYACLALAFLFLLVIIRGSLQILDSRGCLCVRVCVVS